MTVDELVSHLANVVGPVVVQVGDKVFDIVDVQFSLSAPGAVLELAATPVTPTE